MKKTTKLIMTILSLIIFISLLAVGAAAEPGEGYDALIYGDSSGINEQSGADTGISIGESSEKDNSTEGENDSAAGTESQPEADGDESDTEDFFGVVMDTVSKYGAEILSALTLIGSLILAWCYRNGLTPLIKSSLHGISGALGSIKESTEAGENVLGQLGEGITAKITEAETVLLRLASSIEELGADLKRQEERLGREAELKEILSCEIDMLNAVLMSSSLPEYIKEDVRERVNAMREAVANGRE